MPETTSRSDSVNVEQIMDQIRARIREKRGAGSSDEPMRDTATVARLESLLPDAVRPRTAASHGKPADLPSFTFEEDTLFESTRGPLRFIRRLLMPILKLFFNPNPLIQALNVQSKINAATVEREQARDRARESFEQMQFEVLKKLFGETARVDAEIKALLMRIESLATRVEFNERRVRTMEGSTYRPTPEPRMDPPPRQMPERVREVRAEEPPPVPREAPTSQPMPQAPSGQPVTGQTQGDGSGQRSRRRRRRRGRRGVAGQQPGMMGGNQPGATPEHATSAPAAMSGDAQSHGADGATDNIAQFDQDVDGGDHEFEHDAPSSSDAVDSDPTDQDQ